MRLVHGRPCVPTKAEVMRKAFADWADESSAKEAAQDCIALLVLIRQRDELQAGDWNQIQKLAEHLVRARSAHLG